MNDPRRVSLRCETEKQKSTWQQAADKEKRSLSQWIKLACDEAAERQLKPKDRSDEQQR